MAVVDLSLEADICTCAVCGDTKATTCQFEKHHDCCKEEDAERIASYINDEMRD